MFSCFRPSKNTTQKSVQTYKSCFSNNEFGINIIIIKKKRFRYQILDCFLSNLDVISTFINKSLNVLKCNGLNASLMFLLHNQKDVDGVLDVFHHKNEKWQGRIYLHFENDDNLLSFETQQYIKNADIGDDRISNILHSKSSDCNCDHEHKKKILDIVVKEKEKNVFAIILKDVTQHYEMERALIEMIENQLNIMSDNMPWHIVKFLMTQKVTQIPTNMESLTRYHSNVTIMFIDIVGFTNIARRLEPRYIIALLNHFFTILDKLTDKHNVCKVETAGDCYIVSCGVANDFDEHVTERPSSCLERQYAKNILAFSKDVLYATKDITISSLHDEHLSVRIGIHTGDVISGMIGQKIPKFSLFGDTMNIASRMESCGKPNCVHVSRYTYYLLPEEVWKYSGGVYVKGHGNMDTYFLVHQENDVSSSNSSLTRKATDSTTVI